MPSKKKTELSTKLLVVIVAILILAAIGYVIWDVTAHGPISQLFDNREQMIDFVNSLGVFGPVAYILLQITQTVIAPIPSNLVGGIGGFLFGWWGVLYTTIGASIGAAGIFWFSHKLGRGLVERTVSKDQLEKFDFLIGRRTAPILFLIFLIPGLPDDVVCYIAGLTDIPIKKLVAIFAIGRLPAVVVNNYVGAGLSEGNINLVFTIVAVAAIMLGIIYWQQENILKLLNREYNTKTHKELRHALHRDFKDNGKLDNSIADKRKKS